MGLVRDFLASSVDFVKEEILPLRQDLVKAGIIVPDKKAYDLKANLTDPMAYGAISQGYKEKYSLLDYYKCRQITYADPVVAAIIQTRLNQVAGFSQVQPDKYKMGYVIGLRDDTEHNSSGSKKKIRELQQFINGCGVPENFEDTPERKRRDSFEHFLRKVTRDSLTFDQLNFEITPRNDGRPYSFTAVDAATIRVIPDAKEEMERTGHHQSYDASVVVNNYTQNFFREFSPKHPRYAQVINGVVRHTFDEWEMAFGIRNPRTDILSYGYGFSEIEMLITTITSHMNAETYNRKFFSQGSSIKGLLTFEGDVPPDQLEAFRRQWYQQVTGVNNAWRTPIMALGKDNKLNWTSLHSTNREMEFGKWLDYCIKTICGVFQMDPIEIGFDISKQGSGQGGGSGGLGNGNQMERITFSQDKGLRPLLIFIQSLINDYIVYRIDPNFEFKFVGLNVNSEKDDLDRAVQQVKTFKTVNEVRAENDLPPMKKSDKLEIGDIILDSTFIQFVTGEKQAAQEAEQGQQGQPPEPGQMEGGENPDEADQNQPGGEQEEPDYDSMDLDQLQQEYEKVKGAGADTSGEQTPDFAPGGGKKPKAGKADLMQAAVQKSREIEL